MIINRLSGRFLDYCETLSIRKTYLLVKVTVVKELCDTRINIFFLFNITFVPNHSTYVYTTQLVTFTHSLENNHEQAILETY